MPSARSVPSSRVRSNVESTRVLTIPNRDTITASASSTHSTARIWPIHAVWPSMNAALSSALAFGKPASARATASRGASTNVIRLRRWSNVASKAACEIVIGPRLRTSNAGDFSIPRTVSCSCLPRDRRDGEGRADAEAVLGREAVVDERAVAPEPRVAGDQVEPERRVGGIDRVDALLAAERERAVLADRAHAAEPGERALDLGVDRRPAVGRRDDASSPAPGRRAGRGPGPPGPGRRW